MGLGALSRRLLTREDDVVYVTGSVQSEVDRISAGINECLTGTGGTRRTQEARDGQPMEPDGTRPRPGPEIVPVDTSSLETWMGTDNHSLTLLVVPEGIRAASLHRLADHAASGSAAALVLVPRRR
jgi:hypothetical protein